MADGPVKTPPSPEGKAASPPGATGLRPAVWVALLLLCLGGLGLLLLALSDPWGRSEGAIGTPAQPIVFLLDPDHARTAGPLGMRELADALAEKTGLSVQVRAADSPVEAIDAFAGAADVGLLNMFEYILARVEHGVEAGLSVQRKGRPSSYAGAIFVRADSKTTKLAELASAKFAFVSPYSSTGFVFPAKLLADAGVKVEVRFEGTHDGVVASVKAGQAAAGATYADLVAGDPVLRVIATTAPVPNEPVFFRKGLAREKREKVASALLSLQTTEAGRAMLSRFADVTGFARVTDARYEEVLPVVRAAGKTIYDVVPDGLTIEARQRYHDLIPQ